MNKEWEATIESLDFFGNGITHNADGKCFFVKDALPEETVSCRMINEKKSFGTGVAVKRINDSPFRISPLCKNFTKCGGCSFGHVDYQEEYKAKENHVKRILEKVGKIGSAENIYHGLEAAEKTCGYRNHVIFHVCKHNLCFFEEKSHQPVPADDCILLDPSLKNAVRVFPRNLLKNQTEAEFRCDNHGHVLVILKDSSGKKTIFRDCEIINENEALLTYSLCGKELSISHDSFFQINTIMAQKLLDYVKSMVSDILIKSGNVLDLYCGVGTIGICCASDYNLTGIDVVPNAIKSAKINAKNNGVNAHYFSGKAEESLVDVLADLPEQDLILLDPPRQGLQGDTAELLLKYGSPCIIYISCDPSTLARDIKKLSEKYKVISIRSFDLFPRTAHVETVVLLSGEKVDGHIDIDLDVEKLEGKSRTATYAQIKAYVKEKHGLNVSSLYIGRIKDKVGIKERKNYNIGSGDGKVSVCPPEKEKAIMDAFKHFGLI